MGDTWHFEAKTRAVRLQEGGAARRLIGRKKSFPDTKAQKGCWTTAQDLQIPRSKSSPQTANKLHVDHYVFLSKVFWGCSVKKTEE